VFQTGVVNAFLWQIKGHESSVGVRGEAPSSGIKQIKCRPRLIIARERHFYHACIALVTTEHATQPGSWCHFCSPPAK